MTKKSESGTEAWAQWAESMQKMMSNPAALNPFASAVPGLPGFAGSPLGSPFAAMAGLAGMPGFAPGSASMPLDAQSLMKAIDPAEIDRRIQDMRAVESWLKLSVATLEMSIKAMEMQRDAYASFSKMRETADATIKATEQSIRAAAEKSPPSARAAKPRSAKASRR